MSNNDMREALQAARDALEEIALAGMSGTGQESEDGMRAWHARRAWEFIGIAARALDPIRAAPAAPAPVAQGEPVCQAETMRDLPFATVAMQQRENERIARIVGRLERIHREQVAALAAVPSPVAEPVPWTDLLREAELIVKGKPLWSRFIDGTPLANDIAVWMADFAQEHAALAPVAQGEVVRPYGACSITGPKDDVAFILRHLPDVDDGIVSTQPGADAINSIISQHEVYEYRPGAWLEFSRVITKAATGQEGGEK